MNIITINTQNPYKIFIEDNLLIYAHSEIKKNTNAKKIVIISDQTVEQLYLKDFKKNLENTGYIVYKFIFKSGEFSKNLKTVYNIYEFLCEKHISKSDLLIALGGGVVGDITGFVASTYLRGLDYINIPTTLLAQIDSCVGGKTGVNLSFGKNLVGTIYSPKAVFIDPKVLYTLPKIYILDGMAEAIKYGLIKSKNLFLTIEKGPTEIVFNNLIFKCLKIKKEVIEKDEFDENERMILNFGHTLGHAVEKYYNFKKYTHGQAVAIGILYITLFGEKSGITSKGVYKRVENILKEYDLLFDEKKNLNDLVEISLNDKKVRGNTINLVLLKNIGECFIKTFEFKEFKKFMLGEYYI